MSLRPYPSTLPPEALTLVFSAFSGNPVDKPKAIQAGYETLGFALGKAPSGKSWLLSAS